MRRRFGLPMALVLAAAMPAGPEIRTADVDAFYRVYDAASGRPTAAALQAGYVDTGSDGLRDFAKLRDISGATLAEAIAKTPAVFSGARRCAAVLPGVRARLGPAFAKLAALYPPAKFPPVTVVIGRGRSGGTTSAAGVLIGLETLCAADYMDPDLESRFVHLIAHEYIHVQQPLAQVDDPKTTVLTASLIEGGAEFVGEMISGDVGNYQLKRWTKGHEAEIETAFVADEGKTDLSKWLWAGPGTPEHPGDLGYWVGYRIVKAYYDRAADKRQAIRDIIELRDAKTFLARSGWRPART